MKEDHISAQKSIPADSFTDKQGQYLAFIHYYEILNGVAPAEADMQRFFRVSAPSVHQMVLTLEKKNLISRTPGQARSIRVLLQPNQIPQLRTTNRSLSP